MSLNTTSANDEAMRIWTTVHNSEWTQTLDALPEYKVIYGVKWPYRQTVRDLVNRAWKLRKTNIVWQGLDARLLISATVDGSQPESRKADERH